MKYDHSYGVEFEGLLAKAAKNKALLHELLFDLLTPAEYKDLAVRWQIVKLLNQGVTQREISDKLKIGVATITRGSRELGNKKGGFAEVLKKYYSK